MPWSRRHTAFWQQAPLLRPLLFFMAGIFICDQLWPNRSGLPIALVIFFLSTALLAFLAFSKTYRRWLSVFIAVAIAGVFSSLGFCLYALSDAGAIEPSAPPSTSLSLVRVKTAPAERAQTVRLQVERLALLTASGAKAASGDAFLYVYRDDVPTHFSEGDSLLVPSAWVALSNRGNPFEFDYAQFQRRRGIRVQQFVAANEIQWWGRARGDSRSWLQKAQSWSSAQLENYVQDKAALGLLKAMLVGDESSFDPELRQAYAQTGVVHIVSISGSHVAVLYLLVAAMLFWIKGRKGHWLRALLGVGLVWLYVLIAGGPPSALRAAFMFTILATSALSAQEFRPLNTLSAAAFALLSYQPAWMFSVGFQLSFGAVLGMMIFYAPVVGLWQWPRKNWIAHKLWQALAASFSAELLTAPLVVYYFHNFPLVFLPANILAMLLAGFCALSGGLAIIALAWWPAAAQAVGDMVSLLIRAFNACVEWMQSLNVEALQHLQISLVEMGLVYALIVALGAGWLRQWRHAPLVALGCAMLLFLSLDAHQFRAMRQEQLIVFNAGKEPAVVLLRGRRHALPAGNRDAYVVNAALNGFYAWRAQPDVASTHFMAAGHSAIFLNDSVLNPHSRPFPVDVLILGSAAGRFHAAQVLHHFSTKQVVLAGRHSRKRRSEWQTLCSLRGIAFHDASQQGAWVLK